MHDETPNDQTLDPITKEVKTSEGQGLNDQGGGDDIPPTDKKMDVDEEPPSRKTKLDYILQRKQAKLEKEKAKQIEDIDNENKSNPSEEEIERVLQNKFGSTLEFFEKQQVQMEVSSFLSENPDFKQYEEKILKWSIHESYKNIPVEQIAYAVAGKDLLKMGAEKARSSDTLKDSSITGESGGRQTGVKKDVWKMSEQEFEAELERVKRGL